MMTTSVIVSHITLGVSPGSQNKKHQVKKTPTSSQPAFADAALVDGACMSPAWPRNDMAPQPSAIEGKTKHPARRSPVDSAGAHSAKPRGRRSDAHITEWISKKHV